MQIIRNITIAAKQDSALNNMYCYKLHASLFTTSCFELNTI